MILVTGGTGRLGTRLLAELRTEGTPVRVVTRSADSAGRLRAEGVDAVLGDLRDPATLAGAVEGCTAVVAAASGFGPSGGRRALEVDEDGVVALVTAAREAAVRHIVLLSAHGAAADAPIPLLRSKAAAEDAVRSSGLAWTVIRPTAFLETHLETVAAPMARSGRTLVLGSGRVPMNFVSVGDVAALVARALADPALRGRTVDLGGEDLTMQDLSDAVHAAAGTAGGSRRIPLPALRVLAVAARPFSPFLARAAQAAVVMNTTDMRFDPSAERATVPGLPFTRLDEVIRATPAVVGRPGGS